MTHFGCFLSPLWSDSANSFCNEPGILLHLGMSGSIRKFLFFWRVVNSFQIWWIGKGFSTIESKGDISKLKQKIYRERSRKMHIRYYHVLGCVAICLDRLDNDELYPMLQLVAITVLNHTHSGCYKFYSYTKLENVQKMYCKKYKGKLVLNSVKKQLRHIEPFRFF